MIVDTSAIIAVLRREQGHELLEECLASAEAPRVGAPSEVEASIVLESRLGGRGRLILARFLADSGIETVPFTAEHAALAADAYSWFGKRRHPAKLNFGDCCTYAVARLAGEPLLCVGDDFTRTDLELVPLGDET
ncbi:type II toxin-antitoxin system VapC family toxin [Saccharomonospora halophila]|uniref:type II toxin-antitoxin system VapC family toxin n=1 Tax=Saccharomonospora halophila TaxID=129922 RepID=UPI00048ADE62|nr:type II toxin-antitoxin system VapC family toxin [Saccharomonospora halophila]